MPRRPAGTPRRSTRFNSVFARPVAEEEASAGLVRRRPSPSARANTARTARRVAITTR